MKKIMIVLLLVALQTGCSDTMVYLPEDTQQMNAGMVVYIPVDPDKEEETDAVPTEPAQTEPEETEPEQKHTATVSKKTNSSSNKGAASSNKNNTTTNKETVTGSGKPAQTQPAPTEDVGSGQTAVTTEPPVTEYDISNYAVSELEYAILDRINEYRLAEDLEELWLDEYLCAIASCRGYEASLVWSHTRPDGRGYWTVLDDYGYGGGVSGELLGHSTGNGAAVVDKWMNSESNRALLIGSSSGAGIGIYCAGDVIYVACLLVG